MYLGMQNVISQRNIYFKKYAFKNLDIFLRTEFSRIICLYCFGSFHKTMEKSIGMAIK